MYLNSGIFFIIIRDLCRSHFIKLNEICLKVLFFIQIILYDMKINCYLQTKTYLIL